MESFTLFLPKDFGGIFLTQESVTLETLLQTSRFY